MPPQSAPTVAGIYVRISQDTEQEGLGVARQEHACRELGERLGWEVFDVYEDNDTSAYKSKKRRGYERLLADIEAGKINGLLVWAPDRLHRQMRELVPFIDLINKHGVEIHTVIGGTLDLTTSTGKLIARTLGSIAEFESDVKRDRINAKIEELVRDGKVHNGGNRPYGYTRIYQGEGPRRKILRDEVCEDEAALIQEARDRVLAGASVNSIVKDFNLRGVRTSTGRVWSNQAMTFMLKSGRIAGLKEHHRRVVGKAAWPAIVTVDEHEQLVAILTAPARSQTQRKPYRSYWLSGSIYCATCQAPLRISKRTDNGRYSYRCMPRGLGGCGGLTVSYRDIDAFMKRLVIRRLNDPQFLAELAAAETDTKSEAETVVKAVERDERRLKMLQAQLDDEDGDPDDIPEVAKSVRTTRARIAANRDRLARLVDAQPLVGIDVEELEARWEDLDVAQRAGLLRVAKVGRILVHPTKARGKFDPSRIEIEPFKGSREGRSTNG